MKTSLVISFVAAAWSVSATESLLQNIHLNRSLIPNVRETWPSFDLSGPTVLPADLLKETLQNVSPKAVLSDIPKSSGKIARDGDRLVAFVNPETGETSIYPQYEALRPTFNISTGNIAKFVGNAQVFPRDHTNFTIVQGSNLYGSTHDNQSQSSTPAPYLSNVHIQRTIQIGDAVYPVVGPASKAVFGFGADGKVLSLSHLWHAAKISSKTIQRRSNDDIYNAIVNQLKPAAQFGPVVVDSVEPCFYDAGRKHIQPVFRFTATKQTSGTNTNNTTTTTNARISGFVHIGGHAIDTLPDLTQPGELAPPSGDDGGKSQQHYTKRSRLQKRGPQVTVGRYVVRNAESGWTKSANNFWTGLHPFAGLFSGLFGSLSGSPTFVNSQYFEAHPFQYTNLKNQRVNSVNVAETESHGNWHLFTTLRNDSDYVLLSDIPADGYGPGAGGSLAYWILHGCEIIPTVTDYSAADRDQAFAVWRRIFNGMHAAVGYRTEMWIDDVVMGAFGTRIALGAAFVPAWLQTVAHDTADYGTRAGNFYKDGNRGIVEPMGRGSAVTVCGHTDDLVWDLADLGRPRCLREWWFEN